MVNELCELLAQLLEGQREVVKYNAMSTMSMRMAVRLPMARTKVNKTQ